LNTISITSIVLLYSENPTTLVVCTVTSSLSAVGTAVHSVLGLESKFHSHQTSYLQFTDLYDTYQAELLRDPITGEDLDRILHEMNTSLGIIRDNCEPLSRMFDDDYGDNESLLDFPVLSPAVDAPSSIITLKIAEDGTPIPSFPRTMGLKHSDSSQDDRLSSDHHRHWSDP
jgi:hypothetical protein